MSRRVVVGSMKGIAALAVAVAMAACGRDGDGGGGSYCVNWPADREVSGACICQLEPFDLDNDQDDYGTERETCTVSDFIPDTQCCAAPHYNDGGEEAFGQCSCSALRCGVDAVGECTCTHNPFSELPFGSSCTAPVGGVCCLDDLGFCSCSDDTSCFGTEIQVGQCDATVFGCTDDWVEVTDCAPQDDGGGDGIPL